MNTKPQGVVNRSKRRRLYAEAAALTRAIQIRSRRQKSTEIPPVVRRASRLRGSAWRGLNQGGTK